MTMRIGIGYLVQESNSFSPVETRFEDFQLCLGRAALDRWRPTGTEMSGAADVLEQAGAELAPLFGGWAITKGPIRRQDFEQIRAAIAAETVRTGALDGIALFLHGAMCAEGADDCEGALLETVRAVVGPQLPLVLTLDLHANVTARICRLADAVIGYRTYPHVDMYETGATAAEVLLESLRRGQRPVTEMVKLPMILPAENMHTGSGPMAEVFRESDRCRASYPTVRQVSVFGVQPWLDVEEMGCSVVAVAWDDRAAARDCCLPVAHRLAELRHEFEVRLLAPADAVRRALAIDGQPVVLSESSDSPSAGAPGDSADLLLVLLAEAPGAPAALWLCDPTAVDIAWRAGRGALVRIAMGGVFDRTRQRVTVEAQVLETRVGRFVHKGRTNTGVVQELGRTAVLQVGAVSVLVSDEAVSNIDPELYRAAGIEPRERKIVIVKSAAGFRSEYEPMAAGIFLVDTPGVSSANLRSMPYRRVPRPIYPLDDMQGILPPPRPIQP